MYSSCALAGSARRRSRESSTTIQLLLDADFRPAQLYWTLVTAPRLLRTFSTIANHAAPSDHWMVIASTLVNAAVARERVGAFSRVSEPFAARCDRAPDRSRTWTETARPWHPRAANPG
jgi:hypothetical protein